MKAPRPLLTFFLNIFIFTLVVPSIGQSDTSVPNVSAKPGLDSSRRVEMTCGGTKVELVCGYNQDFRQIDDRICSDNKLIFTLADGRMVFPKMGDSPEEKTYTPISISCREELKNPQKLYIYTRYQNGSYNCVKFSRHCNQEVIFTLKGDRVKSSDVNLDSHGNTVSIEERDWDYPADFYADYYYEKEN